MKILIALGSFGQADRLLQIVEKQYPQDVEASLVRIRLEEAARGYKAALAYAETGSAALNENQEFKETYARLLFADDKKDKARALLYDILSSTPNRISALVLLLKDALDQKNWEQADIFADRIIGLGKDSYGADVLELAIQAAFGRRLTAKALTLAEELYATNPRQLRVALPYIQSLIGAGQTVKAADVIDELLPLAQSGPDKSRLLFLKSGTAPNRESRIQILQQALFEDLSNIDALTAISDAYAAAGELRTALRYLRQAAALSPGNTELSVKLLNLEARLAQ